MKLTLKSISPETRYNFNTNLVIETLNNQNPILWKTLSIRGKMGVDSTRVVDIVRYEELKALWTLQEMSDEIETGDREPEDIDYYTCPLTYQEYVNQQVINYYQ